MHMPWHMHQQRVRSKHPVRGNCQLDTPIIIKSNRNLHMGNFDMLCC